MAATKKFVARKFLFLAIIKYFFRQDKFQDQQNMPIKYCLNKWFSEEVNEMTSEILKLSLLSLLLSGNVDTNPGLYLARNTALKTTATLQV